MIKPKSLDELIAAIGPSESDRRAVRDSKVLALHREQLKQVVVRMPKQPDNRRRRRPDDLPDHESALLANTLMKAVVQGVLSRESMEEVIGPLDPQLLERVDIHMWLLPTITVASGSPLEFPPGSVHSLVAYKLIVEPNARIVINGAAVSIDCIELEVQ